MWDADEHGQYPHTETYAVFCDASTDGRKGGCGGAGGYRLTKDDAIEAWNRRAPQPVAREPLTEEQVAVACGWAADMGCKPLPRELRIARAIEAAHGIGIYVGDNHE